MPIFEFVCSQCDQNFEELLRSQSAVQDVTCPNCGSSEISKKISTFASRSTGGGYSFASGGSSGACSTGST